MSKIAVVLLNLGGPDSLDSVEPFLYNLFCDPDIFKLPFGQKLFAKLISNRRAPKVIEEYKLIGGKSPINEWTEVQKNLLEKELGESNLSVDVCVAMRYWKPLTKDTVENIAGVNYDRIILLPLYPHYSISTTGSSFNEWNRHYSGSQSKLVFVKSYHIHKKYIAALNCRIDESLQNFPDELKNDVQLVFSAHGTPVSLVKNGDPYSFQIKETVDEIMKVRNYSHKHHLCYQSKVGPMKWLKPATNVMIEELSANGYKHLLIIPISFVSDHVETLFELNIEYRHVAERCGIVNYVVMKGLNDSQLFIETLKDIVINEILRELQF